ncbi:hypothetical protein CB0940_05965 [Cercospora beticola]|uniref:Uncharacterized protein n=1 Tax=Cercospora beticola TaxID=122368 RepID=A0A2G5HXG8_CERBT|nr:hypothetical protein CB0940_05965 [Cercospora beticola]PIA97228.1 hypothetical protein CB0940_05965 [Cercospora beticola]WPA98566.1 hypothetical protein RHO25_003178 [Cercospora beticola]
MRFLTLAAGLVASVLPFLAQAQCINELAQFNANVRTMSSNTTWFILPIPKAAAQAAIDASFPGAGLRMLDVPNDPSLFPQGFPAGFQPVLVNSGLTDDIRMSALQIDEGLMQGNIYVTYVGQRGSSTPLAASTKGYIAGINGPLPNGLVPAVASPLLFGGNPLRLGQFQPKGAAYQQNGNDILGARVAWTIVPNPISGPGVYPNAFDMIFRTAPSSRYTDRTFKSLINQPIILPTGLCQRNTYYFNNATANPVFRNGNVTLGPGASGSSPFSSGLQKASPDGSGFYGNVDGYSACAQNVGYNPENCEQAARSVDPVALQ